MPGAGGSEQYSESTGEGLDTRLVVFPNDDLFFGLFEHTGVGIYLSKTTGEYVGNCRFGLPASRAFAYTKVLTAEGFAIGEQAEWTLNLELTDGWFFRGTGYLDLEKKHVQPTRYGFLTHPLRGTFAGSFQGGWPSNGAFADLIGSPERGERVVRIINSATRYIITSEYIDKRHADVPWSDRWWDGDKAILWQPGGRLSVWDHDAGVMLRVFGNVACATESIPERKQRELDGFEAQAAQEARDVEIARVKAAWDVEYARVRAERQRQEDANTPTYTWTEADVFARRVQGAGNSSSLGECSACGGRGELQIAMKTVDVWSPVFGWQKQIVQSETCTLCNGTGRH